MRGGTSRVTTEPAPTTASSPIVTPGRTVTFAPSQTFAAEDDARRVHVGAAGRVEVVVEGREDGVVPDEAPVPDDDAALVLEPAAGVDEHVTPQGDVLAEVGGEGREEVHGLVHGLARQLREELADPFGRAVCAVELTGDAQRLLARAVHDGVQRRAARDRPPGVELGQQVVQVHGFLSVGEGRGGRGRGGRP